MKMFCWCTNLLGRELNARNLHGLDRIATIYLSFNSKNKECKRIRNNVTMRRKTTRSLYERIKSNRIVDLYDNSNGNVNNFGMVIMVICGKMKAGKEK